jgi:hypothetical protein
MIKNNFIITEEEKQHILNLTRLPNYKKPVRLKEQYSATITDTPPPTSKTGGESKTDISTTPTSKTGGESKTDISTTPTSSGGNTTGTFDPSYESGKLKDLQTNGGFGEMDFSRNPDVVGGAYDRVKGLISNFYRGRTFGMFADALKIAGKIYPDKEYNGKAYSQMGSDITGITSSVNTAISKVQKVQKLVDWNSLTNPTEDEKSLYYKKLLSAPFEGVAVYQLKDQYMSAEELGTKNAKGPVNTSVTSDQPNKKTNEEAKKGLLGFLQNSKSNVDSSLTDNLCLDVLQTYINDIIPKKTILTDDELRLTKRTIAHCNTKKSSELRTNIFGKVKNKTTGNAYRNLTKKFRRELEGLGTRSDDFRINLTDPDKN